MYKLLDVSDRRTVEAFVRQLEPTAQTITVLAHSYHNVIVVVDEAKAFRLPRTPLAAVHQHYEADILRHLRGKTTVPIPEVLAVHDEPSYIAVGFLHGEHLSLAAQREFDAVARRQVAGQLAHFIFEMGQAIAPEALLQLRTRYGLEDERVDENWAAYIERVLHKADFPGRPWLKQLAQEYFAKWHAMQKRNDLPLQAIHDDLHNENVLFRDNKIAGILDFGLTTVGTPAQEMRQLYRVGDEMVQETISEYERLSGRRVHFEDVQTWAITAELAAYCHRLERGETTHPTFLRTSANLRRWLPEFREHDKPIQAIIFDCFGVLVSEGLRPFRQKYFGHDPALMAQAVKLRQQADALGESKDSFIREIAKLAGVPEQVARGQIEHNAPDEELFAYIRDELKPRYKIGMLSNTGRNRLAEIFTPRQVALFDEVALSYQNGITKPDPRAYLDIAQRLGVPPTACVFVDDQPRYLAGAQAVGMHTIHYKSFDQFWRALDNLLQGEHKMFLKHVA